MGNFFEFVVSLLPWLFMALVAAAVVVLILFFLGIKKELVGVRRALEFIREHLSRTGETGRK